MPKNLKNLKIVRIAIAIPKALNFNCLRTTYFYRLLKRLNFNFRLYSGISI